MSIPYDTHAEATPDSTPAKPSNAEFWAVEVDPPFTQERRTQSAGSCSRLLSISAEVSVSYSRPIGDRRGGRSIALPICAIYPLDYFSRYNVALVRRLLSCSILVRLHLYQFG